MFSIYDEKKWKFFLSLMIAGLLVCVIALIAFNFWLDDGYPTLVESDEIDGRVSDVSQYQSVALIKLTDGKSLKLMPARNYEYNPYNLNYFIEEGDLLRKKSGSDTLLIERNDVIYVFVVGQNINVDLRND